MATSKEVCDTFWVALVACPFCRELFGAEEAERCPHCDILLVGLASLPPSAEALADEPEEPLIDRRFGFFFLGGARGAALALNVLGLALFFAPWFFLERPDVIGLSGSDLARGNAPWLLGGALGFVLNVPLLLSRRSLRELSGIRGIAITFALMTACEVIVLVAKPPLESSYFSARLATGYGLWASLFVSLTAALACFRLGRGIFGSLKEAERASDASPKAGPSAQRPSDAPPGPMLH